MQKPFLTTFILAGLFAGPSLASLSTNQAPQSQRMPSQVRVSVDNAEVFTATAASDESSAAGAEVSIASHDRAAGNQNVLSQAHSLTVKLGGREARFTVQFEGDQMMLSRQVDSPITFTTGDIAALQSLRQGLDALAYGAVDASTPSSTRQSTTHQHVGLAGRVVRFPAIQELNLFIPCMHFADDADPLSRYGCRLRGCPTHSQDTS
jgi:hypothetical protein